MLPLDALLWFAGLAAAGLVTDQLLSATLAARAKTSGSRGLAGLATGVRWLPTSIGVIAGLTVAVRRIAPDLPGAWHPVAVATPRVLAILVATAFTARILGRLLRAYTRREDTPLPSGTILVNLTRATVWVIGGLALLTTVGVSVTPLITALGVGGLAAGLALQPTLENLFSGIQLISSGQLEPGHFIRLEGGDEGTVLDINWRNTTLRKPSNDVVVVPNSVLARSVVTNLSAPDGEFVLMVPVSFASASDPDRVVAITLDVAREVIAEVPEAVPHAEPGARFAELTPPAAVLNVTVRCRSYTDRIAVRHELIRRLAKRFAEEGVEAPPVPMPAAVRRP